MAHPPLFDLLQFPFHHRTVLQWTSAGPTENWWINAVAHSIRHGHATVLLRGGNALLIQCVGDGPIVVTELP